MTQQQSIAGRSEPLRVTGKLKLALDLLVWGGADGVPLKWAAAAEQAGLRTRALRLAMEKRHVVAYINEQKRARLTVASAASVHRAEQIRDQDANKMAALGAIRYLDGVDVQESNGPVRVPGICIQIVNAGDHPLVSAQPLSPSGSPVRQIEAPIQEPRRR